MVDNLTVIDNPHTDEVVVTYAIGDVHGHLNKLQALIDRCLDHCGAQRIRMVFIGDYFDRGPNSRGVIEYLLELQHSVGTEVICLRGNHEADLVACAQGADQTNWLANGGKQTLASYNIADAREIPRAHIEWAGSLPLYYDDGRRLFVHAGIDPAVPMAAQRLKDLLWIREPFLSYEGKFERLVVHGHTPTRSRLPELRSNRVNVDTGAGYDGPLTAAVFLQKSARPFEFLVGDADAIPVP
jgi:serine/threonine protein phosphatase 1